MATLSKRVEEHVGVEKIIDFIRKYWMNCGGLELKLEAFNGRGMVSYVINISKTMNFLQLSCGLVTETEELIAAYKRLFQELREKNPFFVQELTILISDDQTIINVSFNVVFVSPPFRP